MKLRMIAKSYAANQEIGFPTKKKMMTFLGIVKSCYNLLRRGASELSIQKVY